MKFSIIMPTFNRPEFINRAINGVLNQTYQNWELIIQNGGDSILDIIPKDPRIILFEEKDAGITDAMNKGLKKATGDVFNWQNDDDCLRSDALETVFNSIGDRQWVYGFICMQGNGGNQVWGQNWEGLTKLKQANHVPQPSVFWTRKALNEVGFMCEEEDLVSDYEYWLRLGSIFEPLFINKVLADYYIHGNQITVKQMDEQLAQAKRTSKKYDK
ncbi:MAG: glycosyltransferase [Minisyncoccia bacterium]